MVAGVGTLWFQIPFVGNPFVLLLGTSLYLLSVLGIGLLISTVCMTQQQAFATNFFVINPAFILSGFSFPIATMPVFMQWLSTINPMSYYLIVIRGTFLKGVGLAVLWPQMLALAALGVALLGLSVLASASRWIDFQARIGAMRGSRRWRAGGMDHGSFYFAGRSDVRRRARGVWPGQCADDIRAVRSAPITTMRSAPSLCPRAVRSPCIRRSRPT